MSEGFDSAKVNSYLSAASLVSEWTAVTDAVARLANGQDSADQDSAENDLRHALLSVRLHELYQWSGQPASSENAQQRHTDVVNTLNKQATRVNRAAVAKAIISGISALDDAALKFRPQSESLWAWYFAYLTEQNQQRVERVIGEIASQYGVVGAVDEMDLAQRLMEAGLDEHSMAQVIEGLPQEIRHVPTLDAVQMRKLSAMSVSNIVQLIRPQSWEDNPGQQYSAFDAAPVGEQPVGKADLDAARSFFDARNQQTDKDAVSLLDSVCETDQDLRDAVLSYHLVKVRQAREKSFPGPVVDEFVRSGLVEQEGDRLLGRSSGSGSATTQLGVIVDKAHDATLDHVAERIEAGALVSAREMLDKIDSDGNSSGASRALARTVDERLQRAMSHHNQAWNAYRDGNFADLVSHAEASKQLVKDLPQQQELDQQIATLAQDPSVINIAMQNGSLEEIPETALTGGSGLSRTQYLLFIVLPLIVIDIPLFHSVDFFTFLIYLAVVGIFCAVIVSIAEAKRKDRNTTGLVATSVVGIFLLVVFSYLLTAIAMTVLMFQFTKKGKRSDQREASTKWNGFVRTAREVVQNTGMLTPTAGVYQIDGNYHAQRFFPMASNKPLILNQIVTVNDTTVPVEPGTLIVVDQNQAICGFALPEHHPIQFMNA
ncbi:hypothetical protein [Corynebacterium cystitidis]|uniref:hypothetical protein n=1 Tax=Corynebacterium cystitidis TaxID=35757 RepID=UPI00211DB5AD|nr:hypothetical protein [Corynebacterium cystitidis]